MRIPSPRSSRKARIEIIPLIDIIFFLLATFVMVSLSMVKNRGIPVNLPAATTGAAQDRKDFVSITVTEDDEILFNKQKVSLAQLTEQLRSLRSTNADPRIFINGDERASLGRAIEILDETRKLGIVKVAFETKARK